MLRQYWDYLVMTVAIYNCIWTPLTISFDYAITLDDNSEFFKALNWIIRILYAFDILMQFLTSYIDSTTGDEIMKPSMIAKRYMAGEFLVDFMSTFPFKMLPIDDPRFTTFASMCALLKTLRIRKLYQTITQANLTVEQKAFAKIGFYSFLIFVYTHIIGCLMFFFLKTNYLWVAPTDFGAIRSRVQDPWYITG